jgi:Uma2 family endonuclease
MGTADLQATIARRRALGQDRFDEVWEGEYRVVPGPSVAHGFVLDQIGQLLAPMARAARLAGVITANIGTATDYRVPDRAYFRPLPSGVFAATAEIVVEVLSPGDDTSRKFPFYAAHDVREIIIADPATAGVEIHTRDDGTGYHRTDTSAVLDITAAALAEAVDWP